MKKKLLTVAMVLITSCFFSTTIFAQDVPGGSEDGTITQPEGAGTVISSYTYKGYSFKRNNGNGWGVCGVNAQIRVVFDPMPTLKTDIPELTSIIYKSSDLIKTTNYVRVLDKEIINQTQPYVSYCIQGIENLPGASDGNIPPAEKIAIKFNHQN